MLNPALAHPNVNVPLCDDILPSPCIEKSFNLESSSLAEIESNSVSIPDIKPKYLPSFSLNSIISPSCWSVTIPDESTLQLVVPS